MVERVKLLIHKPESGRRFSGKVRLVDREDRYSDYDRAGVTKEHLERDREVNGDVTWLREQVERHRQEHEDRSNGGDDHPGDESDW